MNENKAEIVLDQFMSFDGFCSNIYRVDMLRWCKKFYMDVPTSVVIEKPGWVSPMVARGFATSLYAVDGVIMSNAELMSRKKPPRGVSSAVAFINREILLYEYWANEGSDVHLDYQHLGYVFCIGMRDEGGKYPADQIERKMSEAERRLEAEAIDGKQV